MGYNLYDADGYVDMLGSALDYWNVIHEVELHRAKGPLADFIKAGKTTDPQGVVKDLAQLIPQVTDPNVRNMMQSLKDSLKECKEVAIVDE